MSLLIDVSPLLNDAIKKRGFKHSRRTRQPLGIRIWEGPRRTIIVVSDIKVRPSKVPKSLRDSIEDFFKDLLAEIDKQTSGRHREIFLQGGGIVKIPEWFEQECNMRGIKITIFTIEDYPCDRFLS